MRQYILQFCLFATICGVLTESVSAQTTGDISVEVQVYNRRTLRPLQDAAVYLYQNNSTSGSGGGFYTDANGFIALEAASVAKYHFKLPCDLLSSRRAGEIMARRFRCTPSYKRIGFIIGAST